MLQSDIQNGVLSRLSRDDFSALAENLQPCDLVRGEVLVQPNEVPRYVFFPEAGVVSVVAISPEGESAEAGIIGREGYAVPFVVLGTDRSPNRIEVQVAGHGHRIDTARFVDMVGQREGLRTIALRFAQALAIQTSYTAMTNASRPVDERLARWILMCHDRSDSVEIALTHRFMAVMLCVRRASVTGALQTLESSGLIHAERGYVTVTSRSRLEEFAADAYGQAEAEYVRLMGPR